MGSLNNTALKSVDQKFSVHPAIIYSLIANQASGAPKALLELVMNCVDAGATEINIDINDRGYTIADNGSGFKDKETIASFFGTFGTPHEENDAYYGRFRLGRAQSFYISKTKWYSKEFCMEVDLKVDMDMKDKNAPLGYVVSENHPYYKGCKIVGQFYEIQNVGSVADFYKLDNSLPPENLPLIPALIKMIRYIPCKVILNGVQVNQDINSLPAYATTDNARYLLSEHQGNYGVVNVYNMGVYAYQHKARFLAGDVVATSALDLNIARNEAKATCSVRIEIEKKLASINRMISMQGVAQDTDDVAKIDLSHAQAIEMVWDVVLGRNIIDDDMLESYLSHKCVRLGNGNLVSFKTVVKLILESWASIFKESMNTTIHVYDAGTLQNIKENEILKIQNFFLPRSMFPVDEIINNQPKVYNFFSKICGETITLDTDSKNLYEVLIKILIIKVSDFYAKSSHSLKGFKTVSGEILRIGRLKQTSLSIKVGGEIAGDKISSIMSTSRQPAKLNDAETMVLKSLTNVVNHLFSNPRFIGVSMNHEADYLAFTDGSDYIYYDYAFFSKCVEQGKIESLIDTLIHEYAHQNNTLNTHTHGASFYKNYQKIYASKYSQANLLLCEDLARKLGRKLLKKGKAVMLKEGISLALIHTIFKRAMTNGIIQYS